MFPPTQSSALSQSELDIARGIKTLSMGSEGEPGEQLQAAALNQLDTQLLRDSRAAPDQGGLFQSRDAQIDLQQLMASLHKIKAHNMQVSNEQQLLGGTPIQPTMPTNPAMQATHEAGGLLPQKFREDAFAPVSSLGPASSLGPVTSRAPGPSLATVSPLAPGSSLGPVSAFTPGSSLGPINSLSSGSSLGPVNSLASGSSLGPVNSLASGSSLGPVSSLTAGSSLGPVSSLTAGSSLGPVSSLTAGSLLSPIESQSTQDSAATEHARPAANSSLPFASAVADSVQPADASAAQTDVQPLTDQPSMKSGSNEPDSQPATPKVSLLPEEYVQQLKPHVTCKICQGVLSSAMVLSCGHSFCAFCLFKWLTENQTCPRCPVGLRSLPSRCTALDAVVSSLVPSLPPSEQEHYQMRKTESETACSKVTKLFWHIAQGGSVSPIAQPQQANKLRFAPNPSQHLTQQLQQGQVLVGGVGGVGGVGAVAGAPGRLNPHISQHPLTGQVPGRMLPQAGGYPQQVGMQMNMGAGLHLPNAVQPAPNMFAAQQQLAPQMVQQVPNLQGVQAANLPLFSGYDGTASAVSSQQQQQQQMLLQANGAAAAWSQQVPSNMQLLYGNGLGSAVSQWAAQGRR